MFSWFPIFITDQSKKIQEKNYMDDKPISEKKTYPEKLEDIILLRSGVLPRGCTANYFEHLNFIFSCIVANKNPQEELEKIETERILKKIGL